MGRQIETALLTHSVIVPKNESILCYVPVKAKGPERAQSGDQLMSRWNSDFLRQGHVYRFKDDTNVTAQNKTMLALEFS